MQIEQISCFFNELAPRLQTARVLDEELDRNLARRFNVLDYLRTDELGLSRIIADLLNPHASHGQGVLFLRAFLANLEGWKEHRQWPDLDQEEISVDREWTTDQGRKIDVVVRIEGLDKKAHCLAFENKPYAHDQENQVKDYLGSLEKEYGKRFLLVYLPPTGEGPSEESVQRDELNEWKGRFAIMPYYGGAEERADGFEEFRLRGHSLADWLGECRKNCEVDRLRWFLRDMETFCQRRFDKAMSGDCETKAVQDFVGSDLLKLKTAKAVSEAWPEIKNGVFRGFLGRLCSDIKAKSRFRDDIQVAADYVGEVQWRNEIRLYREAWVKYEDTRGERYRCTTICLQNQKKGPDGWAIGAASPVPKEKMTKEERERRKRLEEALPKALGPGKGDNDWWAWWSWDWVEEEKKNWDSLVLELHGENQGNCGEITRYFVRRFLQFVDTAVPIIDQIEGDTTA